MDITEDYIRPIRSGLHQFISPSKPPIQAKCVITTTDADRLSKNLSDCPGALMVRRVLEHLQYDENLPFRWKMDHKLIQYLVLANYIPELLPKTTGLIYAYHQANEKPLKQYLTEMWQGGFVVKCSRGSNSERTAVLESSATMLNSPHATVLMKTGLPPVPLDRVFTLYDGNPESEAFVVQEKIDFNREFRVHTFDRSIIPSLTVCGFGGTALGRARRDEQVYVETVVEDALKRLPDGLCSNLLSGWDVGMDASGRVHIFEINYTGNFPPCRAGLQCDGSSYDAQLSIRENHPVCRPGFQCSGILHKYHRNIAAFLAYISKTYGTRFEFDDALTPTSALQKSWVTQIEGVKRWTSLLDICGDVAELWQGTNTVCASRDESLRQSVYGNRSEVSDAIYVEFIDSLRRVTDGIG